MNTPAEMETIVNLTYPGLMLMCRDADLSRVAARYEAGMLLFDDRGVDGYLANGGIAAPHRTAVLSNRLKPSAIPQFGPQQAARQIHGPAHFKVLDIYKRLGKTQITLLHLPDAHWRLFEQLSTNLDELLVDYTRKHFDACLDRAPIPELDAPHWRKRCCHPVGLTDFGQPLAP